MARARPVYEAPPGERGRRTFTQWLLSPRTILGLLIIAIAIWFIIANNFTVRLRLWVAWVSAPLWLVLAVTFVAGMLTAYLLKWRKSRAARR